MNDYTLSAITPSSVKLFNSILILAVVYDTSELDRMLRAKRKHIFEQKGVFSLTTEPQATAEEFEEAQKARETLLTQKQEQEIIMRDELDIQFLIDT